MGRAEKDLAKRLTDALRESEEAFLTVLMNVVSDRGMSLTEHETGISRISLHRYVNGRKPLFSSLLALTAALGVQIKFVPSDAKK